jgi:molecular chaperone HtpG
MFAPPSRLKELLSRNSTLDAAVSGTFATIVLLIAVNSLPFFPEYTDHGVDHLRKTLQTADALILEASRPYLTPADAAVLSIAVVLHDLGMHLTEVGFISLITQKSSVAQGRLVPELDAKSWPQLWEDFIAEAKRFNGRTLNRLFGDTEPVGRPTLDPEKLTRRDRKLIGEFLRRHHGRLAHEIALAGIPGSGACLPIVSPHLSHELCDLAGLVARSHGLSVRSCFGYLEKHFHLWEYQGVHAVFLMVVLRVADYIQVEAERAPAERLWVIDIRSPLSLGEWIAHQATRNLTFEGPDPEALEIKATPDNLRTFLRLQGLLRGLQAELDLSWAVLGEIYGRHETLAHLGLELRRVRSNLDDLETFSRSVRFLPVHARFDTADAELLSLLVKPLYGDNVNFGVRELVQNAIDACRELSDVCEHVHRKRPAVAGDAADVVVRLSGSDADGYTLTVKDSGIGMTADTVQQYFLRARRFLQDYRRLAQAP